MSSTLLFIILQLPIYQIFSFLDIYLINQVDRRKNFITAETGYGNANEESDKICSACTNFIEHPEYLGKCNDAQGITFGVLAYGNTKPNRILNREGTIICTLIFSKDLLKDQYYHINTDDNLGFYYFNGKSKVDFIFSDYNTIHTHISYTDDTIFEMTPEIYFENFEGMECLVENSISLDYLVAVGFLEQQHLEVYKSYLDQKNINSYIIEL